MDHRRTFTFLRPFENFERGQKRWNSRQLNPAWEVALLESKRRINLDGGANGWLRSAQHISGIDLVSPMPEVLLDSVTLAAPFHSDPADRIIVATAIALRMPLLTTDRKILAYSHVTTMGPTSAARP